MVNTRIKIAAPSGAAWFLMCILITILISIEKANEADPVCTCMRYLIDTRSCGRSRGYCPSLHSYSGNHKLDRELEKPVRAWGFY